MIKWKLNMHVFLIETPNYQCVGTLSKMSVLKYLRPWFTISFRCPVCRTMTRLLEAFAIHLNSLTTMTSTRRLRQTINVSAMAIWQRWRVGRGRWKAGVMRPILAKEIKHRSIHWTNLRSPFTWFICLHQKRWIVAAEPWGFARSVWIQVKPFSTSMVILS